MKYARGLIVCFILLLVAGCKVTTAEIDFAVKVCADEGGLKYYRNPVVISGNALFGDAHCTNGVVVIGEQWQANEKARGN